MGLSGVPDAGDSFTYGFASGDGDVDNKLFKLDLETKAKTQLTFGTATDAAAQFLDDHTLAFASTAADPLAPIDPTQAANADIYNIWTLDLDNGELRQYTDTATGNVSAIGSSSKRSSSSCTRGPRSASGRWNKRACSSRFCRTVNSE